MFTEAQNRSLLKVFPIVFLVGLCLGAGGLYFANLQVSLLIHGKTVVGEVITLEAGTSSSASGRSAYHPIVTFRTTEGGDVTFRHRTGANPSPYKVGDKVAVVYLPSSPNHALIAEGAMNWLLPVILLIVAPGLLFISVRGFLGARRRLGLSKT